ncbi:hypothetical protein BKA83DRAFT_4130584 [Pisolithus microcarpus]|nr:hypothetical protein BKA83DRAFT_4130584 [Pisolithus microcarpus]
MYYIFPVSLPLLPSYTRMLVLVHGSNMNCNKKNKQCAATECWLLKPGYRGYSSSECEMSKERRQDSMPPGTGLGEKHTMENEATMCGPTLTSTDGDSLDMEPSSYLHPSAQLELPLLEKIRQLIVDWQSKWGVESTWPKKFHEQLKYAQGRG